MKNIFHINGMHCKSCELIIEQGVKKIPGVTKAEASHKSGILEIESSDPVSNERVSNIVKSAGYEVVDESEKKHTPIHKNTFDDYATIIILFISTAFLAFILSQFDVLKFLPDVSEGASIGVALLIGIVASVSTCLALVGGIVLSFGDMYPVKEDHKHPLIAKATPHIYFHIGRILGFALLGGLLGLVGSKINYSASFTGYLTVLVAIIMFYIGLQILNLAPNITKLGFHLPKTFAGKISKLQDGNHNLAPALIGVLTFFVPCGFTQSMQLIAITSKSLLTGALVMGFFALGTMPVLFSLGLGSTYAQKNKFSFFHKVIGVVIVLFALYSANSGLALTGNSINFNLFKDDGQTQTSQVDGDVQVVKMDVDWGFNPDNFTIKKGVPVRWEINGINISGCVNSIIVPGMGIGQRLSKGSNVIEFTPTETGILDFSCGMGMVRGQFNVVD